ncbi:MAG: cupin domain-containing protein [Christensenellales bacterium]
MITSTSTIEMEVRKEMRGGPGEVLIQALANKADMPKNCRVFSIMTLKPGCGIGYHEHKGEMEFYHILEGEGVVDDNGTEKPIKTGDTMITVNGEGHSITNNSDKDLKMIACVVMD